MDLGYIDRDPFAQYKTTYKEVSRGYLTAEELKGIEQKSFELNDLTRFGMFSSLFVIQGYLIRI